MLIQFNFSNYKSYKNSVSLDMTATNIQEHPYHLITKDNKENYLRVAAIYGANASGKSVLIEAFEFMKFFVLESFKKESEKKGIPIKRFAFEKQSKIGKSEFEVFFSYKGKEYQYGFVIDNKKVYEEWLYKRDFRGKNKFNLLFERSIEEINCRLKDAEKFKDLVEDSTLFLSLISNARIKDAKYVYEWFLNSEVINFGNVIYETLISSLLPMKSLDDLESKERLEKFLKAIDVGIEGIEIEKNNDESDEDGEPSYKVFTKHKLLDGNGYVKLNINEESSGTLKMFSLYRFLVDSIRQGDTLFIDELDAKLHPALLRYIINMFNNPETNPNNAQLIYSTHDIYTLTKDIFRRDEIWFVEKDASGISDLYSLVEYRLNDNKKVRNDASYNKDYITGRYGAIPILKEFYPAEGK